MEDKVLRVIVLPDGSKKGVVVNSVEGFIDTKYGRVYMKDLAKAEYGCIKTTSGFEVRVLKPSIIDLIELFFERASQVIYPKDSSLMIALSGIKSGSIVGEAGTGSGFLTAMLAHTIYPGGRVYSFDVRSDMIKIARRNLELTGYSGIVDIYKHDIRTGIPVSGLEAFFLDMPDPWNALKHVYSSLKPGGSLLVFLPTVNQVSKILRALNEHGGFTGTRVMETQVRFYKCNPDALRPENIQVVHTGYIVFSRRV